MRSFKWRDWINKGFLATSTEFVTWNPTNLLIVIWRKGHECPARKAHQMRDKEKINWNKLFRTKSKVIDGRSNPPRDMNRRFICQLLIVLLSCRKIDAAFETPLSDSGIVSFNELNQLMSCIRRVHTIRVKQVDSQGRSCWDHVSSISCWGRCQTYEVKSLPFASIRHSQFQLIQLTILMRNWRFLTGASRSRCRTIPRANTTGSNLDWSAWRIAILPWAKERSSTSFTTLSPAAARPAIPPCSIASSSIQYLLNLRGSHDPICQKSHYSLPWMYARQINV